jgi:hypothetical protein
MDCQSSRNFHFMLAILGVSLIFFSPFFTISIAQSESVGAPSAIPYYETEEAVVPQILRGLAIPGAGALGSIGGTDVPLGGSNEPAIAVNPQDPTNVVVARLFAIRVSTDTGATFSAPTSAVVPGTHVLCGDPSVAFDSQGRLFWTYLGCFPATGPPFTGIDAFIAQVNPTTGAFIGSEVNVTAAAGVPGSAGNGNDKEWLAVDRWAGSLFQDRIYLVWTNFLPDGVNTALQTSFSTNQGATWSPAVTRSAPAEGFHWPSHNAVAANGDVYVAYHSQPTFSGVNPNGTSGQIIVLRSTDGGANFTKTTAYTGGNADITFNDRTPPAIRLLNQNQSWTQGSAQPWVLPDPLNPNNVYVVAADDPTNTTHSGTNDDMNVYIVRSTNSGATWSAPAQVNTGAPGTTQFFPTATIDDQTACIVVNWYDTRKGAVNGNNNFLLDVFTTVSNDGGLTFAPETQINDTAFNPDLGATDRFPPSGTLRIGEYIGVAVSNGRAHSVWTGNTTTGQQILYENSLVAACAVNQPPVAQCQDVTVDTDPGVCTAASASVDNGSFDPDGDPITLVQAPPPPYSKGTTNVTLTVTDDQGSSDSCTAIVTVVDKEPPALTCPAPQTVECTGSGSGVATYSATATDNCGIASLGCVPPSGSSFPLGTTAVICNATDASGNLSSCSSSVTVVDSIAPTVMCVQSVNPSDKNVPKASNEDGFYKVSASDICTTPVIKISSFTLVSGETIKITQTPGKSGVSLVGTLGKLAIKHFQVGPNDAVITATDGSGNQASVTCLVPPPPK